MISKIAPTSWRRTASIFRTWTTGLQNALADRAARRRPRRGDRRHTGAVPTGGRPAQGSEPFSEYRLLSVVASSTLVWEGLLTE